MLLFKSANSLKIHVTINILKLSKCGFGPVQGAVNESGVTASSSGHDTAPHSTDRGAEIAFARDVTETVTNHGQSFWLSQWQTDARDVYLYVHMIQQQHCVEQE